MAWILRGLGFQYNSGEMRDRRTGWKIDEGSVFCASHRALFVSWCRLLADFVAKVRWDGLRTV